MDRRQVSGNANRGIASRWGRAAMLAFVSTGVAACERAEIPAEHRVIGADAEAGRAVIVSIACGVCHVIPGIRGATGIVGPSLAGFGRRQLIGGVAPNRPAVLVQWIRDAPSISPSTGMPELPLSEAQARDVAAYLFTLR